MAAPAKKPPPQAERPRSKGAVLLSRTGLTASEIAVELDVGETIVKYWRLGEKVPPLDKRRSLSKAYAIPVEAWDEPASLAAVSPMPIMGDKVTEADIDRAAVQLFGVALYLTEKVRSCESVGDMAKVAAGANAYLEKSARMAGISLDVSEAKLLRTPAWRRVHRAIFEALRPFPEAARAVGEAILTIGQVDK